VRHFLLPFLIVAIGNAEIEQAILKYLSEHFPLANAQYVCEFPGVAIHSGDADSMAIDGFGKENPRGRTTVRLSFYRQGEMTRSSVIGVKIGVLKPVLVASTAIFANSPIPLEKVKFETRDISEIDEETLDNVGRLEGKVSSRFIPAGRILTISETKATPTIRKGDRVNLILKNGALTVESSAIARDDGLKGEKIRVVNVDSKRPLTGVIIDSQTVLIGEMETTSR